MIIVINSQGGLVAQQVEDLFQGSSQFNEINLIAPMDSSVNFFANFELPNGEIKPNLQGDLMTPSITTPSGLNVWKLKINYPITKYDGILKVQLRAISGDVVICTTTAKFSIQKGVPYQSEYVEETTYDAIVNLVSDIRALLNGKVDINHLTYAEDPTVDSTTEGTRYVYTTEGYVAKTLPQDYEAGTTYYTLEHEQIIGNNDTGLYAQLDNVKLEIKSDGVYINNVKIARVDDLTADKISFDNETSGLTATNVQGAIDEVEARVDTAESDITAIETRMDTAEEDIDLIEGDIRTINSTLNTHTSQISNLSQIKANRSELPAKLSDLTNDTGFITKAVNNLTNYYLKTQTYTKTEVEELISGFSGELKVEFVTVLPTASETTWFTNSHTFYFLKASTTSGDEYDEYLTRKDGSDYVWEKLGGARIDLSNYYTKSEVDNKFLPTSLGQKIEGSDYISVDTNQAGTKLVVELDETNLETEEPEEDSEKLITSGAVYEALANVTTTTWEEY